MTAEWQQLKLDLAPWIAPDALDWIADFIPPDKIDTRAQLLELAEKFGRGSRLGIALRVINDNRTAKNQYHPMTVAVLIGAVRFMCEAARPEDSEEHLERELRKMIIPPASRFAKRWANQNMEFYASASSQAEARAMWVQSEQLRIAAEKRYKERFNENPFASSAKDDPSIAEARKWLRKSRNPSALATNRFHTTAAALAFVEALYAAGAKKVLVENIDDSADGGLGYADSMCVMLPKAAKKRVEILRVINDSGRPETDDGGPVVDEGKDEIHLWWD